MLTALSYLCPKRYMQILKIDYSGEHEATKGGKTTLHLKFVILKRKTSCQSRREKCLMK